MGLVESEEPRPHHPPFFTQYPEQNFKFAFATNFERPDAKFNNMYRVRGICSILTFSVTIPNDYVIIEIVSRQQPREPLNRDHVQNLFAHDCCRIAYDRHTTRTGAPLLVAFPNLVMLYSVIGNYKSNPFDAIYKPFLWPEHRLYDARIACHNHRPRAKLVHKPHLSEIAWRF